VTAEIVLASDEVPAGKPFVDPVHTRRDEEALRRLLGNERERARMWADPGFEDGRNVIVRETDSEGHRHLLVVPDTRALLAAINPVAVGFFGRPRVDADHSRLFGLEEELVQGMSAYAADGLLSYYDVELVKGAYGNLILFRNADGPMRWRENPVHRRAVEISPGSYHEIRLHQGVLAGRLLDGGALTVVRTRYLDYSGPEPWRAVRSFESV
jgi:hypothetical protein